MSRGRAGVRRAAMSSRNAYVNIPKIPTVAIARHAGVWLVLSMTAGCSNPQTPGFNGVINDANGIAAVATGYYAGARVIPFAGLGNHGVTGVRVTSAADGFNLADFARAQIETLAAQRGQYPSSVLTGVVTKMDNGQCSSGSGTIEWDDKDGDQRFSSGDTFVFTFNNCGVEGIAGNLVYDNRMSLTQFTLDGDPQNDPSNGWKMGALFTLDNLSVTEGPATRVYNGAFNFSSVTPDGVRETIDITGQSLTGTANNAQDVLKDFTLNEQDDRAAFTYSFTADGTLDSARYGVLTVKTQSRFSGTSPFDPSAGTLLVTASDNSSVRMVVDSSTAITVQIDSNGDGTFDTTQDTAWSVLASV